MNVRLYGSVCFTPPPGTTGRNDQRRCRVTGAQSKFSLSDLQIRGPLTTLLSLTTTQTTALSAMADPYANFRPRRETTTSEETRPMSWPCGFNSTTGDDDGAPPPPPTPLRNPARLLPRVSVDSAAEPTNAALDPTDIVYRRRRSYEYENTSSSYNRSSLTSNLPVRAASSASTYDGTHSLAITSNQPRSALPSDQPLRLDGAASTYDGTHSPTLMSNQPLSALPSDQQLRLNRAASIYDGTLFPATSSNRPRSSVPSDLPLRATSAASSDDDLQDSTSADPATPDPLISIPEDSVMSGDRGSSAGIARAPVPSRHMTPSADRNPTATAPLQRSASVGSRPVRCTHGGFGPPRQAPPAPPQADRATSSETSRAATAAPARMTTTPALETARTASQPPAHRNPRVSFAAPEAPFRRNTTAAFQTPRAASAPSVQRNTTDAFETPRPAPQPPVLRNVVGVSARPQSAAFPTTTQQDSSVPYERPRTAPPAPVQRHSFSQSPAPRSRTPAPVSILRNSIVSQASTADDILPEPGTPERLMSIRTTGNVAPRRYTTAQHGACTICQKIGKPLQPNPICCAGPPSSPEQACVQCWQESLKMSLADKPGLWMCCLFCARELPLVERTRLAKRRTLLK